MLYLVTLVRNTLNGASLYDRNFQKFFWSSEELHKAFLEIFVNLPYGNAKARCLCVAFTSGYKSISAVWGGEGKHQ